MTNRDYLIYTLRVCGLWLLTYWRRILAGIALMIIVLLLTSCVVGTLPTPQPTPTATATAWSTNTPTNTATSAPTEVTPTGEVWIRCVLDVYAYLDDYTLLYQDEELTRINVTDDGIIPEVWKDQPVFLYDRGQRQPVRWVQTATNIVLEGYLDNEKLPVECR
jgi:hypothetical protein